MHFLFLLLLLACSPNDKDGPARDLLRDLTRAGDTTPSDTATVRADSQFQTCLYVYETEAGLRECPVVRQGWRAEDAARRIAVHKGQIARLLDSLYRIRDSLELIARQERRERLRRQQIRDSIAAAPESARVQRERWDSAVAADSADWGKR